MKRQQYRQDIADIIRGGTSGLSNDAAMTLADTILSRIEQEPERTPTFHERAEHFASRLNIGYDDLHSYFTGKRHGGDISRGWRIAEFDRDDRDGLVSSAEAIVSDPHSVPREELAAATAFMALAPKVDLDHHNGGWHVWGMPDDDLAKFHAALRQQRIALAARQT